MLLDVRADVDKVGDNGKVGLMGSGDGDGDRPDKHVAMKMDNC